MFEIESRTILTLKATFRQKVLNAAKAQILATLMLSLSLPPADVCRRSCRTTVSQRRSIKQWWTTTGTSAQLSASSICASTKATQWVTRVKGYALLQKNDDDHALPHLNAAIKGGVTSLPSAVADSHANNLWSLRGYSLMRSGKIAGGNQRPGKITRDEAAHLPRPSQPTNRLRQCRRRLQEKWAMRKKLTATQRRRIEKATIPPGVLSNAKKRSPSQI